MNSTPGPFYEQCCEFCAELQAPPHSRFHDHLGPFLPSRIVLSDGGFVAMPSMGQIVPNSLMLLPVHHVERFADLCAEQIQTAAHLLRRLMIVASRPVALFEHGARSRTGGSCGIYHAHLHLIPLPEGVLVDALAMDLTVAGNSFPEAMRDARRYDQYLFLSDGVGRTWLRPVLMGEGHRFPSQYFRRLLASAVASSVNWDWRRTRQPEAALVGAYRHWKDMLLSTPAPH